MISSNAPGTDQVSFVRLSLIQPFLDYLNVRNIKTKSAFSRFGVDEAAVQNSNAFVYADIVYGLLNEFADLAADPYLGLRVGEEHDFSEWPPFTDALASGSTLFDFFSAYIAHVPNEANSVEHTLTIGAEGATYCVKRANRPAVPPIQVTGFACAQYVRLLKSVTGASWDASSVIFESKHVNGIPSDYCDIQIRICDSDNAMIHFPAAWLTRKRDVELGIAKATPAKDPGRVSVVLALRPVLESYLHEPNFGIAKAAKLLGLEADRLEKALKRSGTTLAKEQKKLKIEVAKLQLRRGELAIGKIGHLIGYSDPAHFTRFFRSQTGMSPIEFQRQTLEK